MERCVSWSALRRLLAVRFAQLAAPHSTCILQTGASPCCVDARSHRLRQELSACSCARADWRRSHVHPHITYKAARAPFCYGLSAVGYFLRLHPGTIRRLLLRKKYFIATATNVNMERERSQGTARWAQRARATLDEVTRIILFQKKAAMPAFLPPARTGLGGAQIWGQGDHPLAGS